MSWAVCQLRVRRGMVLSRVSIARRSVGCTRRGRCPCRRSGATGRSRSRWWAIPTVSAAQEEHVDPDERLELIPLGHLHATVPGERQLVLTDATVERLDQCREDRTGSVALGQISEQTHSAGPIEQRHDRGPVEGPQDQVALEVAGLATFSGLRWTRTDRVEQAQRTFAGAFGPKTRCLRHLRRRCNPTWITCRRLGRRASWQRPRTRYCTSNDTV